MRDELQRLTTVFRDIFDAPDLKLTAETSNRDISDWDSVAQVKLILAIEEEFGVEFDTNEVATFHSVADFLSALQAKRAAA